MSYSIDEVMTSQQIFYYLLENRELEEAKEKTLYYAYTSDERIMNLVKNQGEVANCTIERYGNTIYLIPNEANEVLGFSKKELKKILCKSTGTDKDYYLSQFAIMTLLVEFYDGQGRSSKAREFLSVGELQNVIAQRLKEGANAFDEQQQQQHGIAYKNMKEAFDALHSDAKGTRKRTTKEGFLRTILVFLQEQGLIEYVELDEMIMTTKKLDQFMDFHILNQNNFQRVHQIIKEVADESH
ncbi:MAG: DUF6063 family protein [Culicoidibacterales bacterium]